MDSIGDLHKSFVYAQIHALRIRIALDGAAVRTALCAAPQAELLGSSMRVSVEPHTALQLLGNGRRSKRQAASKGTNIQLEQVTIRLCGWKIRCFEHSTPSHTLVSIDCNLAIFR